eukprot:6492130-Amphidinium_carterae.3
MYGIPSWVVMWYEEAFAKKRAAAESKALAEGCIDSDDEVHGDKDEEAGGVGKGPIGEEEEEAEEEQDVEQDLDEDEEEEMDKEQMEALARLKQREAFVYLYYALSRPAYRAALCSLQALALRDAEALAMRAAEVVVIYCPVPPFFRIHGSLLSSSWEFHLGQNIQFQYLTSTLQSKVRSSASATSVDPNTQHQSHYPSNPRI